jgi:GDPmannose 4,6-dehydratase
MSTNPTSESKKRALIFGIGGQDGSYLAEHLYELGYEVFGTVRRNSVPEHQASRIDALQSEGKISVMYGDLMDPPSIERAITTAKPDEVYNLAAQSHVRISFDVPMMTTQTNAVGVLYILDALKRLCPNVRFYQASSSEMFGNSVDEDGFQRETTPMHPVSPYGCAKLFGFNIVRHYRNAHKLWACNGILFNHESPRRGSNFVTNKVVKAAVRIKLGLQDKLELGNMDSFRDWGHSKDYVKAMHMIVNHDKADDFVVATGKTHSIRQLCEYVFTKLDLDYKDYVVQNPKYMRPEELKYLKGDCSKFKETFNWEPEYSFETLMDEMIDHWMVVFSENKPEDSLESKSKENK